MFLDLTTLRANQAFLGIQLVTKGSPVLIQAKSGGSIPGFRTTAMVGRALNYSSSRSFVPRSPFFITPIEVDRMALRRAGVSSTALLPYSILRNRAAVSVDFWGRGVLDGSFFGMPASRSLVADRASSNSRVRRASPDAGRTSVSERKRVAFV